MKRVASKVAKRAIKKASVNNNVENIVCERIYYLYYEMIAESIKKADINDLDSFLVYGLPGFGKLIPMDSKIIKAQNGNERSKPDTR